MARPWRDLAYRFSLVFFVALNIGVLLAALFDITQQLVVGSDSDTRAGDIIISAATYVFVGLVSVSVLLSRVYTVRKTLMSLPKAYMPVNREDLPKSVHNLVTTEYARCALILVFSQHSNRFLPGWGPTGHPQLEHMHLRTAMLKTVELINRIYTTFFSFDCPVHIERSPSPYQSPLRALYPVCFEGPTPLLALQARRLFIEYDRLIEFAKYGEAEPTVEDCEHVLKLAVAIVQLVGEAAVARWPSLTNDELLEKTSIDS